MESAEKTRRLIIFARKLIRVMILAASLGTR